jgi:flagellar biosynthesis protein FlhA
MAQSLGSAALLRRPLAAHVADYALPTAILLAVLVVLAPVPAAVVDLLLAANLTMAVLALLGALAARTPLELSVFPSFLLGATLIRLVLNISTTRLILSRAAVDGASAAGEVVAAFGDFVAANNLVVGGVVFAIIAVVQFVVITAGSTRTSEVAARFTLDGLPGRQMAIDSELQAGTLTREQARLARQDLQRQADFFAAMDGASRFVRGEAVASVVITLVNLVGGLAIGMAEHGMPADKALSVYSLLTIGDGLASAVPALFVSVATGLLLSRSTQSVDLSGELGRQFGSRPHVLAITAVFLGLLSISGLPFLPLAMMALGVAVAAVVTARSGAAPDGTAGKAAGPTAGNPLASGGPSASSTTAGAEAGQPAVAVDILADERIVLELGEGLVHLVAGDASPLAASVASLRGRLAADLGIVLPAVSLRDDLRLADRGYRITVAGEMVAEGAVPAGRLLVLPAIGEQLADGEPASDPLTGRSAAWMSEAGAEAAAVRGGTVVEAAEVVARSLEASVRRHADRLLSRDAVSRLVESLRASQPAVVEQIVPGVLSIARIQRTLQCLLREGVPIRPLAELLEIMSDHAAEAAEPWQLAEIVRRRLAGSICRRARDPDGRLTAVRLAPAGLATLQAGPGPATRPPARLLAEIRRATRVAIERGGEPVLLVPVAARHAVREALARSLPDLRVIAEEEAAHELRLEVFATVGGATAANGESEPRPQPEDKTRAA